MTFEEAENEIINIIVGEQYNVLNILNKLKETYAPKVKMTIEQKNKFMIFISEDEEFEDFWYCYGYGRELYKEFSENEMMHAWLHPELIEVRE